MKNFLKDDWFKNSIYTIGGILIFVAMIVVCLGFIFGSVWLSSKIMPILLYVFGVIFWICCIIVLPMAFFKKTQSIAAVGFFIASYVFGITLWFYSFFITYSFWGIFGIIIGLMLAGIGVFPLAIIASAIHSEWWLVFNLIITGVLTYGFRYLGLYLDEKSTRGKFDFGKPVPIFYNWQKIILWIIVVATFISITYRSLGTTFNLGYFLDLFLGVGINLFILWILFKIGNWIYRKYKNKNIASSSELPEKFN